MNPPGGTRGTHGSLEDGAIWTPDRRLRVFVSSTVGSAGELAEERRAVARAIAALRLTPVLFEAGARPHPPGELYRAYLVQSDVFVGLYWQRYGRIGPGMRISGLEEELELARAQGLPRLLYVKLPAPDREARLAGLLDRIKQEAADSYRYFRTPAELGRLVRDDLATLLSERFADTRPPGGAARRRRRPRMAVARAAAAVASVHRHRGSTRLLQRLATAMGRSRTPMRRSCGKPSTAAAAWRSVLRAIRSSRCSRVRWRRSRRPWPPSGAWPPTSGRCSPPCGSGWGCTPATGSRAGTTMSAWMCTGAAGSPRPATAGRS